MKKVLLGVLVGIILSVPMYAAAEKLPAIIGKTVQGTTSILIGVEYAADAIIIDGTSYAPVRAIAELVGMGVSFENGKIILTEKEGEPLQELPATTDVNPIAEENKRILEEVRRLAEENINPKTDPIELLENEINLLIHFRAGYAFDLQHATTEEAKAEAQAKIDEIDAQIAEKQAQLDALKVQKQSDET